MARSLSVAPPRRSWVWSLLVGLVWVVAIYFVAMLGWVGQFLLAPRPKVAAYTVDKPDRMLAAILLRGEQAWFFKVAGFSSGVEQQAEAFDSFVNSIRFSEATGNPEWKLPEGWSQSAGAGAAASMRFATLHLGSGPQPLELTIMTLPKGDKSDEEYLLANVNRWRDQLSLPEITATELATLLPSATVNGVTVYRFDVSGRLGGAKMPRHSPHGAEGAPFAGTGKPPSGGGQGESAAIRYQAPKNWQAGKVGGMRKAAFDVHESGKSLEITVIDLPADTNPLIDNVNRWRGQVKLGEIGEDELAKQVQEIEVDGRPGFYVELIGPAEAQPRETLLGVVTYVGGRAWFVKLKGDPDLAAKEKQNFEAFVRSIQF